jgi:ribosomal protein S14
MKYLVARDKYKRKKFLLAEKKINILKSIIVNKFISNKVRQFAKEKANNVYGTKGNIRNYCILTTRSRSVIKKFNISRMSFKYLASFGYLKNIKKASW